MFWLKSGLAWLVEMRLELSGTFLDVVDSRDERNDELVVGVLGENNTLLSMLVGSEQSCVRY